MSDIDPTAAQRFWPKVDVNGPNGCWVWLGAKVTHGYGRFRFNGRAEPAYRVSYRLVVGPIPEGKELDHLCRNPPCVNPAHLEPVTHGENVRRGMWSAGRAAQQLARTHCANGHEFTPENTYRPPATSPAQRQCRICRRAAKARANARKREANA